MKAAVVGSPGEVVLIDMPTPSPKPGEVLVRMRACGVCGTDVEKVYGEAIAGKVLGHEAVGEVAEVGGEVAGAFVGQRVFTHHHVPCYSCELCSRGKPTFCREYRRHNLVPCGLSEYYILPAFNVERGGLVELPRSLSYEEASFIEPLGCCIRGLNEVRARGAASALIYGAGPIGITHLKLLKSYGIPRVGIAEVSDFRRSFADRAGADVSFNPTEKSHVDDAMANFPEGPELVIVATGAVRAFEDAMRVVRQGGRVLQFGAPDKKAVAQFDLAAFYLKGVELVTSYAASEEDISAATELLAGGGLKLSDAITHKFPLGESAEAFKVALQQACMKAVITN